MIGPGTDLATQARLIALEQHNSELLTEKFRAEEEVRRLRFEIEKLGVDPEYLRRLEQRVAELERREGDLSVRVKNAFTQLAEVTGEVERHQRLKEAFGDDVSDVVIRALDRRDRRDRIKARLEGICIGCVGSILAALPFMYL